MIDLNKEQLTKEKLREYVSDYDIFDHYISDMIIGKIRNSPIRKDVHPSFAIFYAQRNNMLMFKDQATGETGDCIKYVMNYHGIDYYGALSQVAIDFGLDDRFICSGYFSTIIFNKISEYSFSIGLQAVSINGINFFLITKLCYIICCSRRHISPKNFL